jgi:IS5 family transposase
MVNLESLVKKDHEYRKFNGLWKFEAVDKLLDSLKRDNPHEGYGLQRVFKCLLLQFMEDLSDRELERYIAENYAARWFCGFNLTESTPNYSVYSKARGKIGLQQLSKIFELLRNQLKSQGYISEVFSFVDASHLISKAALWKERDEVIKLKYEKLNNESLPKVAKDKDARIGCKGKDKFWYGYKKHVSVDMQTGLINKIAVTPANTSDSEGFKLVCPDGGATYCDKAYATTNCEEIAQKNNVTLRAIKKNNMKNKNYDLDRWITKLRSPYERIFSQDNKRVRYVGLAKNQFAEIMNAITFNLRRLSVIIRLNLPT